MVFINRQMFRSALRRLALIMVVCTATAGFGQSDDALFAQMLAGSTQSAPPQTLAAQFRANLSGRLQLHLGHFVDAVAYTNASQAYYNRIDPERNFGSTRLQLQTHGDWQSWRFATELWLESGFGAADWRGVTRFARDNDNYQRHLEIDCIYARWHGAGWQLTLGKQHFANGLGSLYSSADMFERVDYSDPLSARRLGVWQARLDWTVATVEFSAALLPLPSHPRLPAPDSRWYKNDVEFWFRDQLWMQLFLDDNILNRSDQYLTTRIMDLVYFAQDATRGFNPSQFLQNQLFAGDSFDDVRSIASAFENINLSAQDRENLLLNAQATMAANLQPFLFAFMHAQQQAGMFVLSPAEETLLRQMLSTTFSDTAWTLAGIVRNYVPVRRQSNDRLRDTGVFLRGKTMVNGWNLYGSAFYGHSPYPVLYFDINNLYFEERLPQIMALAGGFATTYGDYEVHGESTLNYAIDNDDETYLAYVLGSTRMFANRALARLGLERLDLTLSYAGTWTLREQGARGFVADSRAFRIGNNDLLARLALIVNDRVDFELSGARELDSSAGMLRVGANYKRQNWTVALKYEAFEGSYATHYGFWNNGDRVMLELSYAF